VKLNSSQIWLSLDEFISSYLPDEMKKLER
jgi:hypothetical protein